MTTFWQSQITADIAPGSTQTIGGDVTLSANVGTDAHILVVGGDLKIKGDVENGVTLRAPDGKINIEGTVGDHVTIDAGKDVTLENGAGASLRLRTPGSASIGHIGDNSYVRTGGVVMGGNIGRSSHVASGRSCTIGQVGHGSVIECGEMIEATLIGHDCQLTAKDNVYAATAGADTVISAGGTARIGIAHEFMIASGADIFLRERSRDPANFILTEDEKWNNPAVTGGLKGPSPR